MSGREGTLVTVLAEHNRKTRHARMALMVSENLPECVSDYSKPFVRRLLQVPDQAPIKQVTKNEVT